MFCFLVAAGNAIQAAGFVIELAGYHMQGRRFAVGHMRGLFDATAALT
jgi:hypothetical protein